MIPNKFNSPQSAFTHAFSRTARDAKKSAAERAAAFTQVFIPASYVESPKVDGFSRAFTHPSKEVK